MKNIKMGIKLVVSYLLITLIALITCMYLLTGLSTINDGTSYMYDKVALSLKNTGDLNLLIQMQRSEIRGVLVNNFNSSPAERDANLRRLDSVGVAILGFYNEEEKKLTNSEEDANFRAAIQEAKKQLEDFKVLLNKYMPSFLDGTAINTPPEIVTKLEQLYQANDAFVTLKEQYGSNLDKLTDDIYDNTKTVSYTILAIMVIASIIIGLFMTFAITGPLNMVVETLKKGEDGDMRARVDLDQKDEIGVVAYSVNHFFEKFQGILRGLNQESDTLSGASEELSSVSRQLASGAEETVSQSNTVASTTEQMAVNINAMASGAEEASANANEVASAAEQMSTNMNTIASAIEEMSASINQIAGNTTEVRKVATDATNKSGEATDAMGKLGLAAKEIGQVTDVIKRIADKTNLLALNATIEAASAGEAGKGFAVVAGEIKELANQSATSADDIARRIEGIQSGTTNAVAVIKDVAEIIEKINHSVEAIAGHVEQQTKASNEIASNVAQANTGAKRVASSIGEVAKGANDVSRNAGEAAKGATNVSHNVVGMAQAAKESAQGASQVNQSAKDLSKLAGELKETVNQFRV